MAEDEIVRIKETIFSQYINMKKLYIELEVEREASATAASEALSMILRLQREKAKEKMEANQYKRLTEEKLLHAEESMEILKQVMEQQDMEIEFLKNQLMSCRHKHAKEKGNRNGSSASLDKNCFVSNVKRIVSLPVIFQHAKFSSDDDIVDDEVGALVRVGQLQGQIDQQEGGTKSLVEDDDLDDLKHVAEFLSVDPKSGNTYKSATSEPYKSGSNSDANATLSVRVHDIYEVPEISNGCIHDESMNDESMLAVKNIPSPTKSSSLIIWNKRPESSVAEPLNCRVTDFPNRGITEAQNIELLRNRLQLLDDEIIGDQDNPVTGKDQSNLLKEICERLNAIESQIKSSNLKKYLQKSESPLTSFMEAALSFSI